MFRKKAQIYLSVSINCHFVLFLCFFGGLEISFSQDASDSLETKSYEYLFQNYYKTSSIETKEAYTNEIIERTKQEKDTATLIGGYYLKCSLYEDDERVIHYSDSIIELTKNNSNKTYPAVAYIAKGRFYFNQKDSKKSLKNFLEALTYSEKHEANYLIIWSKYHIALTKKNLGDKLESLELFKEILETVKKYDNKVNYINTLYSIATIYYELENFDQATHYNSIGLEEAINTKNSKLETNLLLNKAVIAYFQKDLQISKKLIEEQIPNLEKFDSYQNLAIAYLFLGKIENHEGNHGVSIKYLKKADSIITFTRGNEQKFREIYTILVDYYEKDKQLDNQLIYLNKLIRLDSILNDNQIYLNRNIYENYEIPKLLSDRNTIIRKIEKKNRNKKNYIYILVVLIIAVSFGFVYQFRKKRQYSRRFREIMIAKNDNVYKIKSTENKKKTDVSITEETANKILENLQRFENERNYLESNITLPFLAKQMNTNSKYLSKVISTFKGKSFTTYINDLRINYVVEELKTNKSFRKYTLLAIANEIGFKKTESFSKAFKKVTEITPSYFIKELSKN